MSQQLVCRRLWRLGTSAATRRRAVTRSRRRCCARSRLRAHARRPQPDFSPAGVLRRRDRENRPGLPSATTAAGAGRRLAIPRRRARGDELGPPGDGAGVQPPPRRGPAQSAASGPPECPARSPSRGRSTRPSSRHACLEALARIESRIAGGMETAPAGYVAAGPAIARFGQARCSRKHMTTAAPTRLGGITPQLRAQQRHNQKGERR